MLLGGPQVPILVYVCLSGCLVKGRGRSFALKQTSSQQEDPSVFTAWTPPPDYALKTVGHKTMYLADVSVGANGQAFRMLVDTGSPLVILPGSGCKQCKHHFDTRVARPVNQTASVKFGLGEVSGHLFEDTVCLRTPQGSAQLTEVGFLQRVAHAKRRSKVGVISDNAFDSASACAKMSFLVADQESADFAEQPFDGILGLGPESSSDVQASSGATGFSFLSQLVANGVTHGTAFALRLTNSGASQLFLDGIDETSFAGGRAVWVPLSPVADGFWQFTVQDMTLDNHAQEFGSFQVAVDSGTSLLAADEELAQWFRQHLLPKNCDDVDHLPKLGLRISGGSILSLLPADYIDQTDGKCDLALMPSNLQSANGQRLVLGDSFLHRYTTIFDRQNLRMGFGVAADDSMANQMLPAMFPTQTTTVLPSTTDGPPPPAHLDYGNLEYVPSTTLPPPTAEELRAHQNQEEFSHAFTGLGDDLAGTFEHSIATEKARIGPHTLAPGIGQTAAPLEGPSTATPGDSGSENSYLSYLK